MADIAALGLRVDSDGIVKGTADLDKFASSADKAGSAADRMGREAQRGASGTRDLGNAANTADSGISKLARDAAQAQAAIDRYAGSTNRATSEALASASAIDAAGSAAAASASQVTRLAEGYDILTGKVNSNFLAIGRNLQSVGAVPREFQKVSGAIKLTARDGLNFSRQFADIGVTAAMGMNPLMIAIQQGPQLFDILQERAIATGATIGAVAKAAGAQIWAALAPILPIVLAIAAAVAAVAAAFALGARNIRQANGDIISGLGLTEKQLERVKKSGVETGVTIGDTFFAFFDVVGDRLTSAFEGPLKWLADAWNWTLDTVTTVALTAIKLIAGTWTGLIQGMIASWRILPGAIGDTFMQIVNGTVAGIEFLINKAVMGINSVLDFANSIPGVDLGNLGDVSLGRFANQFEGQGKALGDAFTKGFDDGMQSASGAIDRFLSDVSNRAAQRRREAILAAAGDPGAAREKSGGKTEAEKFADLVGDVTREIALIETKTRAVGLSADAALRMENQQKLLNDAQAKGITLTDAQTRVLMGLADELTAAQIALKNAEGFKAINDGLDKQIRALSQANTNVGLYGEELYSLVALQNLMNEALDKELTLTQDQKQALADKAKEIGKIQAAGDTSKFMEDMRVQSEASMKAMAAERAEMGLSGAALAAYRFEQELLAKAERDHIILTPDMVSAIKERAKAYGEERAQIDNAAAALSALNGVMGSGSFGQILGILTSGNPVASLLGSGGIGTMIGLLTKDGQQAYTQQRKAIEAGLVSVFGEKASGLAKTLGGLIQGAATGSMAADTILGGNRGTASNIGAAIGGAAGQAIGNLIGGPIGGMIGSAILGTLGGFLGSIFGGTPKGAVTVNGNRITGTTGKGDQLKAATQAGDAIIGSLASIAKALGGTVGTVRGVTIGMRKDDYIVDPTGQGRVKGSGVMNFGKDAEAAALAATKLLIERGVIQGIRASTQNILKAGGDLETQLNKAIAFEAVFKELEAASSPFAASLKEMQAGFTELTAIFVEAKASAEEYAQLQEFIALRQKQLVDQAMANYRSTFYSDAENTAYARQTISSTLTPLGYGNIATVAQYRALVEATDALANPELFGALMDLSDEFGTLQQAADNAKQASEAAAAAQEALNAQRGQMEVQLLRLQGKELEATAKARQQELAAMDPSLRALQQQINLWTDIAAAQDVLRTSYEREKGALEEAAEALRGLGDTLRDFRKSLDADEIGSNPAAIAARFREVSRMASMGDQTAMGNLPQSARDYLDSVRSNARSEQEYLRALAEVRRATDSAIGAADAGVTEAERQLEQLKLQVGALININDNVVTVAQAIDRLTALWNPAAPGTPTPVNSDTRDRQDERDERMRETFDRLSDFFRIGLDRLGAKQDQTNRLWGQIAAGVVPITVRTDPIEPLEVVTP